MAVVGFTITPIGTESPSLSKYVAEAEKIIKASGVKSRLTPMATVLEGDLNEVLKVIINVHNRVFELGVKRVVTNIDIDDRRDKELTMEGKVRSVEEKL